MVRAVIADIFRVIAHASRKEMLYALDWDVLTYNELRAVARRTKSDRSTNLIAYHIVALSFHHLIGKTVRKLYYLTYRGKQVVRAMKAIEKTEMFI